MTDERKQAEEITATEYIKNDWGEAWLRHEWQAGDVIDALQQYAALKVAEATKEMYPKEFIAFCNDNFYWDKGLLGYLPTTKKYQGVIFKTTDELFEYWKQNIQGK